MKLLLTQKLPDSTVVLIHDKTTVKDRCDAVVKEFSKKSTYAQTDLRAKFMAMRCPEKMNPREFLESLRVKKEELSQAGVTIEEKDYLSVILSSLPFALSNFASSILASSHVSSNKVTSNDLLSMLMEESDRQRAQRSRGAKSGKGKDDKNEALAAGQSSKQKKGKGKSQRSRGAKSGKGKDDKNEALAAGQSSKQKKGKGKSKHADLTCYNCNEIGHISCFCKKPKKSKSRDDSGKEKKGDGKGSGSGTANAVESSTEVEEDGAWVAVEEMDWFKEAVEEMENEGWANVAEDFKDTSEEAFVTETAETDRVTELYDSGCMNHISPYRLRFKNFVTITPRLFRAANKETFSTIGKGDLVIDVPDGDDHSQLRLKDVLYSPNVDYTLVSIRRLDEDGFTASFGNGRCLLTGPDGEKVGEVLRSSGKVYKVEHGVRTANTAVANAAVETLTLGQLHRHLGHPSIQVARDLIKHKMVTGIRLEYTTNQ